VDIHDVDLVHHSPWNLAAIHVADSIGGQVRYVDFKNVAPLSKPAKFYLKR
jgi:hypothetical protein